MARQARRFTENTATRLKMRFQGAVIREQGVSFAIVVVQRRVLTDRRQSEETAGAFQRFFPGLPIVLMGQDTGGVPTYYGRHDIVRFMSRVPLSAVPWKEYTFA